MIINNQAFWQQKKPPPKGRGWGLGVTIALFHAIGQTSQFQIQNQCHTAFPV